MPERRPLTRAGFARAADVSRETLERLDAYLALLVKWQARINLVGDASLADPWRRHMLDSAQLRPLVPADCRRLVDLGSGAGFPGLVLAVLGVAGVELVESDARKCAFLAEAVRVTGAAATVRRARIEALAPAPADAITARALAPLARLLEYAEPLWRPGGVLLALKGADVERELTEATKRWTIAVDRVPSRSDPEGTVLVIREIARAARR